MARAGRKRKEGVKREANGRASRRKVDVLDRVALEDRETLRPALEARVRIHGIAPEHSRDQMAGSFVGRLCMGKQISVAQYDAAMLFLQSHRDNTIAIQAPKDMTGVDLNRVQGGGLGSENTAFYRQATTRWRAAVAAVQGRQNELRSAGALYAALQYCVLEDKELHHLAGWLREGLNALVRHYGLGDRARVA